MFNCKARPMYQWGVTSCGGSPHTFSKAVACHQADFWDTFQPGSAAAHSYSLPGWGVIPELACGSFLPSLRASFSFKLGLLLLILGPPSLSSLHPFFAPLLFCAFFRMSCPVCFHPISMSFGRVYLSTLAGGLPRC